MGLAVHSEGAVAIRSVVSPVVVTSGAEPADERQGKLSNEGTIWFFFCPSPAIIFGRKRRFSFYLIVGPWNGEL